jgi:hypothetical protein
LASRQCLEYPTVWRLFGVSTGTHCYIQLGIQTPPATRVLRNTYFGPADPEASKLRSNTITMYLGAAQCTSISSWSSPSVIASTGNATVQHRRARLRALFIQYPPVLLTTSPCILIQRYSPRPGSLRPSTNQTCQRSPNGLVADNVYVTSVPCASAGSSIVVSASSYDIWYASPREHPSQRLLYPSTEPYSIGNPKGKD